MRKTKRSKTKRSKTKTRNRKHNYLGKARIKYYSIKKGGGGNIYSERSTRRDITPRPRYIIKPLITPRPSRTTPEKVSAFELKWAKAEEADNNRQAEANKAEADMRASTAALATAPIANRLVARMRQHQRELQAMEADPGDTARMTEERPPVAAMRAMTRVNEYKKAADPNLQLWGGKYGYGEQVKGKGFRTKARRRNGSKKRRLHRKRTARRSRRH